MFYLEIYIYFIRVIQLQLIFADSTIFIINK